MVERNTLRLIHKVVYGVSCLFSFIPSVYGCTLSIDDNIQVDGMNSLAEVTIIFGFPAVVASFFLFYFPDPRPEFNIQFITTLVLWIVWLGIFGGSIGVSSLKGSCSRYIAFSDIIDVDPDPNVNGCHVSSAIAVFAFLNWILLMFYIVFLCCYHRGDFILENVTNVLLCCYRCDFTPENVTDTELTAVGNNGVSTLEDGRDTELTTVGNNGVSTLEDGRDTELTAVENTGVTTLEDGKDTELTAVGNTL